MAATTGRGERVRRPNLVLRRCRELQGWSQADVAAQLVRLAHDAGGSRVLCSANVVGRWERGERRLGPTYVGLLCRLYGSTPDQLGLVAISAFTAAASAGARLSDDVERRESLRHAVAALGVAVVVPSRLPAVLSGVSSPPTGRAAAGAERTEEPDRPWLYRFGPEKVLAARGTCLLRLHDAAAAQAVLQDAMTSPALSARRRGELVVELADSRLEQRDLVEGCSLLIQAVDLARRRRSQALLGRVQASRRRLDRWQDAARWRHSMRSFRRCGPERRRPGRSTTCSRARPPPLPPATRHSR